ncbi:hypothetical protein [Clostridium gasigenes]|uniref:Uncharacterized protein n=1 Tax=Clostridium gasigenes TaxID=94869 RepID=A0A7X0SHS7_9CLOT|nr:hypothetical protein [Clostridium gasigenes]MBB6716647.1 hypothetical protein [Clostridium gasigenes]
MKKILFGKEKRKNGLRKRIGDDKLVVSLVLIAVGVVLCFIYRTEISKQLTKAVGTLGTKINDMFNETGTTPVVPEDAGIILPHIINFVNMIKF